MIIFIILLSSSAAAFILIILLSLLSKLSHNRTQLRHSCCDTLLHIFLQVQAPGSRGSLPWKQFPFVLNLFSNFDVRTVCFLHFSCSTEDFLGLSAGLSIAGDTSPIFELENGLYYYYPPHRFKVKWKKSIIHGVKDRFSNVLTHKFSKLRRFFRCWCFVGSLRGSL